VTRFFIWRQELDVARKINQALADPRGHVQKRDGLDSRESLLAGIIGRLVRRAVNVRLPAGRGLLFCRV